MVPAASRSERAGGAPGRLRWRIALIRATRRAIAASRTGSSQTAAAATSSSPRGDRCPSRAAKPRQSRARQSYAERRARAEDLPSKVKLAELAQNGLAAKKAREGTLADYKADSNKSSSPASAISSPRRSGTIRSQPSSATSAQQIPQVRASRTSQAPQAEPRPRGSTRNDRQNPLAAPLDQPTSARSWHQGASRLVVRGDQVTFSSAAAKLAQKA